MSKKTKSLLIADSHSGSETLGFHDPDAPCMAYLPTFGHFVRANVGK